LFPILIAIAIIITGYDVTHCSNCRQNKVGVVNDIKTTTDRITNDSDGIIDVIDEAPTNDATNTTVITTSTSIYL